MSHIFQASDLAAKRRELMDSAREGLAQIRDTDGTGLVMLREAQFEQLREERALFASFVALEGALTRPLAQRRTTDYGDFAWLAAFDEDDQETFRSELLDALAESLAHGTLAPAGKCIDDWRRTARALSSQKVREALTGVGGDAFTEVERPE